MHKHFAMALALALTSGAGATAADTYVVDKVHSQVGFRVRHLVGKVSGRFTDFEGKIAADAAKPEASSVEFVVKTTSIDTDNNQRDNHLRSADFFDVAKYAEITFRSTKVTPLGSDRFDVLGTLTMHGVSKDVTLPVSYLGVTKDPWGNDRAGFEVATRLNRKDFGIVWNQTLDTGGLMLGDDVEVTITLEAIKPKPQPAK
jgi:polyisoprenoid-binding protein YceI